MKYDFDLVVIGAGPGGYVAAIRAAQLGMRVAVVEQDRAGGVCLNWGCIPSKAILTSAELYDELVRHRDDHGIRVDGLGFDYGQVIDRSRRAADRLAKGVESLFKKNKITAKKGRGRLLGPHEVVVEREGESDRLTAKNVLLATGSTERTLPGLEIDGKVVLTSRQALECRVVPHSIVIIGAGAVGMEFAYVYSSFGARVTVVEMMDQLLPGVEPEIAEDLARQYRKRGMRIFISHAFRSLTRTAAGAEVVVESASGKQEVLAGEQVLVAVGRRPLSANLGLEQVGVAMEKEFVRVGPDLRTTVPSIYAIGDLAGAPLVAHKASAEGIVAVENMADGGSRSLCYERIPLCIYCQPEIAVVGFSEAQARERGHDVVVSRLPFRAIGKAVASGHVEGFVKYVVDRKYGEILGCHMIGKGATDLIAEPTLAMSLEATTTEIGETVHAHPTLSEAIMEGALAAERRSINF